MNNAKMWLVVKPTVGVPIFLSAVAIGSFAVHVAVLTNTSWVSDFLSGQELGSGDQADLELKQQNQTAKAGYVTPETGEVTIILSDGTPVKAILQPPEQHASATAGTALITR